nr:T9SS sorting signal type C domain-containing protein [uncultured Flavobacterium sp.]
MMRKLLYSFLFFIFLHTAGFGQCAYITGATSIGTYNGCIDNTVNTSNLSAGQFAQVNVIRGYSYTFSIGNVFNGTGNGNRENLTIFDASNNNYAGGYNIGQSGASVTWTATFSGAVKVLFTRDCNSSSGSGPLSIVINSVGNNLDDQTIAGSDVWRGHIYNWTSATLPPGGTSPASPATSTPFTDAEYAGYYDYGAETIPVGYNFGGDGTCLNVFSIGTQRASIYTETFAVRYRMKSNRAAGCYLVTVRGDDGVRLYVDNVKVFDEWKQQSTTEYANVLVYLKGPAAGGSDLVLDYYENTGGNQVSFSINPFDPNSNTIIAPTPSVVCNNTRPNTIDGSSYTYNGSSVNPSIKYQWQTATNANGPWTDVSGETNEDYRPLAVITSAPVVNYYRRVVSAAASNASACTWNSNVISITTSVNGSITSVTPVLNSTTNLTCSSFTANWNSIPSASSYRLDVATNNTFTTLVYNNVDVGLTTSFNVTGLTTGTTYFYRIRGYNGCGPSTSNNSNIVTVTTILPSVTISGGTTVCQNATSPSINFTNSQNSAITVTYNINGGTNTTLNVSANSVAGISAPTTASGTFTYNLVSAVYQSVPTCSQNLTGSATINVNPTSVGGSIAGSTAVCTGTNSTLLTLSGHTGSITRWESSLDNFATTGTPISNTSNTYTATNLTATTSYRAVLTSGVCSSSNSSSATVTVNPVHTITAGSNRSVCQNSTMTNITMNLGGGATGATVTGLPAGVTYAVASGVLTISGTPTVSGVFPYSVTTTGNSCTTASTNGTITIGIGNNTITYAQGTSGYVCINADESNSTPANFIAPTGTYFNTVSFASYGTALGSCPSFTINSSCHAPQSQGTVESKLLGNSGTIPILPSNNVFPDPCVGTFKYLRVVAYYSQTICSGTAPGTISGSDPTGNGTYTYEWQSSTSAAGPFTAIPSTNSKDYTPGVLAQSTYFRRVVTSAGCTSTSPILLIKVNPLPTIATVATASTICNGATSTSLTYTGTTGAPTTYSITWNASPANTFAAVTDASLPGTSPISITIPSTTAANTYTGTITVKNANGCISTGNSFTLTVRPQFSAGAIDSTGETICYGGNPSSIGNTTFASGGDGTITYQWQSSTDAAFTAPVTIANNNSAYTPPTGLTVNTWYRRQAKDGTCNTTFTSSSNVWAVTVRSQFTAGAINSAGETICYGGNPSSIGNATFASGGNGIITYQWQSSTDAAFTAPVTIANNNAAYTPPTGLTVNMWYRRQAKDGTCNTTFTSSSNVWAVTVRSQFTAGTINSTGETICSGGNPSQIGSTTDASGGNGVITYQWQANGVNIASSNSAVYTPPAGLTTTTTYTRYANDGICNTSPMASSGSWTVTVNSIQNKPSIGTITNVTCLSQGSVILGNVPSSGSFQINQTGDTSRSITVPSSTGSTYTVSGLAAGTYYFTVQTATTCVSTQSDPVTITDQSSTTWNGSGWSHGAPDSSKSVIIASTAGNPFPTNIEACSLTITVPSGPTDLPVIVKDGITLTITNAVTSNGKLLFESGSNLVQKTDVQNTGEIIYQRKATVARYDLTYWGMPVAKPGFTMKMFSPNTLIDKYFILEPSNASWVENYNGTFPMIAGKGYSIRAPQSFPSPTKQEFIGTFEGIPNNGDIPVTVVSGKWNLIGNPYPSSINAEKFRDDNPGIGALYFWAHVNLPVKSSTDQFYYYTDDFVVYNGLGSVDTGEANYFKGQIGAAQGFIVKAPTATVNFNNSQRNGGNNSQFYKTAQSTIEKNRVWLNLKNTEGIFKQILLGYTTGATNALDVDFDALSMASNPVVDFYSIGTAKKLTIQGRALPFVKSDVVPLGYLIANKGDYTISIDHADGLFNEGQDVFLEDKTNGKITNLRLENYKFTTAAGTFNNRFAIRYTSATLGVDDVEGLENSVLVSVKNREVKITSSNESIKEVNIFDIGAQLIYTKNNVNSTELQISNLQSSDQALLVKITLENGYTFTKKIIFSNL